MKKSNYFKSILVAFSVAVSLSNLNAQKLIAGWDFQTTTNGGTAIVPTKDMTNFTQNVFIANFGSGTLYLDGTYGTGPYKVWSITSNNGVGSWPNAGDGFSEEQKGSAALAIGKSVNNKKYIVFKFLMTDFKNLLISYSALISQNGFNKHSWAYSTDGVKWTECGSTTIENRDVFKLAKVPVISALDNATDAFFKITLDGATTDDGTSQVRFDNIKFKAIPIK
jgi:hypothetical protein